MSEVEIETLVTRVKLFENIHTGFALFRLFLSVFYCLLDNIWAHLRVGQDITKFSFRSVHFGCDIYTDMILMTKQPHVAQMG